MTQHWNRLPRGIVESPSLEVFRTQLGEVLCSLLWVSRGVGLDDLQRSLPTPAMLGFCDKIGFCGSIGKHSGATEGVWKERSGEKQSC